jgi:predicted nuclease of predicted toxin-antitoxin system
MKLLLDTCVSRGAQVELASAGHDVVHTGESEPDPGDEEILAQAHRDSRILITLDKDFGELAIIRGHEHSGIVRLVEISAKRQGAVCKVIIEQYGEQLAAGAIVTVEPGRVRVRSPSDEAG